MMNQPTLSVLLVEDEEVDAINVRRLLQSSKAAYQLTIVDCFADAKALWSKQDFNVMLVDLGLPDAEPFEPVRYVRERSAQVAIVVLSGNSDQGCYVDAVKSGADDYICKGDLNAKLLCCRIEQARQRVAQKSEIRSLLETVNQQNADLAKNAVDLEQKNKKLQKLCDSSEVFVNHVSHEFRTPLCVIKQYASLMAEGGLGSMSPQQIKTLNVIEDRVDGLSNLVDDMLDISRHEAGLLSARRSSCQISDWIEPELDSLRQRGSIRQIQIECRLDPNLPNVFCDQEKSGRILTNLVTNAIKFSPTGSQIDIHARFVGDGKEIAIDVTDRGPGISDDAVGRLVSRFQQTSTSRLACEKGFGLGLSIANELAELNLGRLSVASTPGEGSVFTFTIPIDDPRVVFDRYLNLVERSQIASPIQLCRIDAKIDGRSNLDQINAVHSILEFVLRCHDLLVKVSRDTWQVTLVSDQAGAEAFLHRVRTELAEASRNCPSSVIPDVQFCVGEVTTMINRIPAFANEASTDDASTEDISGDRDVVRVDHSESVSPVLSRIETIAWLSNQPNSPAMEWSHV
jgi:signal transduction histidine kinase